MGPGRKTKAVSSPWAPSFPWTHCSTRALGPHTHTRVGTDCWEQEVCIVPQETSVPNSGTALWGHKGLKRVCSPNADPSAPGPGALLLPEGLGRLTATLGAAPSPSPPDSALPDSSKRKVCPLPPPLAPPKLRGLALRVCSQGVPTSYAVRWPHGGAESGNGQPLAFQNLLLQWRLRLPAQPSGEGLDPDPEGHLGACCAATSWSPSGPVLEGCPGSGLLRKEGSAAKAPRFPDRPVLSGGCPRPLHPAVAGGGLQALGFHKPLLSQCVGLSSHSPGGSAPPKPWPSQGTQALSSLQRSRASCPQSPPVATLPGDIGEPRRHRAAGGMAADCPPAWLPSAPRRPVLQPERTGQRAVPL